jgi:hypothetical protein
VRGIPNASFTLKKKSRKMSFTRGSVSGGGKFRHPYVFQMTNNVSLGLAIPVSLMVVEAPL